MLLQLSQFAFWRSGISWACDMCQNSWTRWPESLWFSLKLKFAEEAYNSVPKAARNLQVSPAGHRSRYVFHQLSIVYQVPAVCGHATHSCTLPTCAARPCPRPGLAAFGCAGLSFCKALAALSIWLMWVFRFLGGFYQLRRVLGRMDHSKISEATNYQWWILLTNYL